MSIIRTKQKPRARSIAGIAWPTLRIIIIVINCLLILNLWFSEKKDSRADFHTVINQHESSILQQCDEEAYDLRNERHRNHKSPFHDKICEALPLGATAASLWRKHADQIYQASLHPLDPDLVHAPWTKDLQNLLTPHLLERGLRNAPSHESLQTIFRKIQRRLRNPDKEPPLEVAVVGGSVTEGGGCESLPVSAPIKPGVNRKKGKPVIRGRMCAWPFRLQRLVDQVLGEGVIRIHNLAVGGTSSGLSTPLLDYWLFPPGSPLLERGPDVILNGYAANDNLPPGNKRGDDTNVTGDFHFFYRHGLAITQNFIRKSLLSRPCDDDPLVLFVDEYLGNQHNVIEGELYRFEAVDLLTRWYPNTGAVSPAHVVRRLVYGNTNEDLFSAAWLKKNRTDPEGPLIRRIDVHAGMTNHVNIAWTVAYALLGLTLQFCEEETGRGGDHDALHAQDEHHHKHHDIAHKFVPPEALGLIEEEIPPVLDAKLLVKDVAQQWHDDAVQRNQSLTQYCGSGTAPAGPPCVFAFVAAPAGTVHRAGPLNGYMKSFTIHNDGWSAKDDIRNGWQNKLGYEAQKANATLSLQIKDIPTKIRKITIHSLKSYGEKWDKSQAKFSLKWNHTSSGQSHETSWDILGYHDQQTSISYPFVLDLGVEHTAERGSTVDLRIDLVGGTTFKINAMMLCSR